MRLLSLRNQHCALATLGVLAQVLADLPADLSRAGAPGLVQQGSGAPQPAGRRRLKPDSCRLSRSDIVIEQQPQVPGGELRLCMWLN
jgi:hypothetical protein